MCLNFPGKQWDGVWGLGRKACWGFLRSSVGDEVVPGSLLRPGISEEFPWYRHSPWGFGLWVSCDLVYGVSILCSAFVHCATFILFLQENKTKLFLLYTFFTSVLRCFGCLAGLCRTWYGKLLKSVAWCRALLPHVAYDLFLVFGTCHVLHCCCLVLLTPPSGSIKHILLWGGTVTPTGLCWVCITVIPLFVLFFW